MLLRVERGKVTAEITRGPGERLSLLWGDADIAVMLLPLEIKAGQRVPLQGEVDIAATPVGCK